MIRRIYRGPSSNLFSIVFTLTLLGLSSCGPVSPSLDKKDFNPQPQSPVTGSTGLNSESDGALGSSFLTSDVGVTNDDGTSVANESAPWAKSPITEIKEKELKLIIEEFKSDSKRAELTIDLKKKPLPKRVWFVFDEDFDTTKVPDVKNAYRAVLRLGSKKGCTLTLGSEWPIEKLESLKAIIIEH